MSYEVYEHHLTELGQRMLDEAQEHNWERVAAIHNQLQQRLIRLFQDAGLPSDERPRRLLERLQSMSEQVSLRASQERDRCRESWSRARLRQQAVLSYDGCRQP